MTMIDELSIKTAIFVFFYGFLKLSADGLTCLVVYVSIYITIINPLFIQKYS